MHRCKNEEMITFFIIRNNHFNEEAYTNYWWFKKNDSIPTSNF